MLTLDEAVAKLNGVLVGEDTAETYDEHGLAVVSRDEVIAAVRDVALAAIDSLKFLNIEGCGDCQDTAQFDAKATIHRLLKGESERGARRDADA